MKKAGHHHNMTPPLTARHSSTLSLRSPASSPNLSVRSAISSPPTIKIEDSVLEFPDSASESEAPTNESEGSSASSSQQKIFQLPPINCWVPKGESMFTSILDSRSPQIYRRTTTPTSKTASYPPSPQNDLQSSRVSWPQFSQAEPLVPASIVENTSSDIGQVEGAKDVHSTKSPKLLRKCTSFDLERSKPFPSRSSMTSPMLLRKNTSLDDTHSSVPNTSEPNLVGSPKQSESYNQEKDCKKIVHKEEDENIIAGGAALEVPHCESKANVSYNGTCTQSIAGDNTVQYLVKSITGEFDASRIKKSLEDPSVPKANMFGDNYKEHTPAEFSGVNETDLKGQVSQSETVKILQKNTVSAEKDKEGKFKKSKTEDVNGHVGTEDSKKSTKVDYDSKGSPKAQNTSKSKLTKGSSKEGNSGIKPRSKTPASTVKSALLTSAAKLKAIGRKSPVTLLSYKSHSISIPDHSRKVPRPSSTSELNPGLRPRTGRIHQTESSPTVLVASVDVAKENLKEKQIKGRSVSPTLNKSEVNKRQQKVLEKQPDLKKTQGLRKSPVSKPAQTVTAKTKASTSTADEKKVKPERMVTSKSAGEKQVKSVQSKVDSSVKHSKEEKAGASGAVRGQRSGMEPSVPQQKSKKLSKHDSSVVKEEKVKTRQTAKRGSISSINSDSARPTGHFHDCCHSRKRLAKK